MSMYINIYIYICIYVYVYKYITLWPCVSWKSKKTNDRGCLARTDCVFMQTRQSYNRVKKKTHAVHGKKVRVQTWWQNILGRIC